jgi:hypothetical protein
VAESPSGNINVSTEPDNGKVDRLALAKPETVVSTLPPSESASSEATLRHELTNRRQKLTRTIRLGYIGIAARFTRLDLITAQGIRSE